MANWFLTKVPRQFNEERYSVQQIVQDSCISTCKRMKLDPFFILYTKVNLEWIIDLNKSAKIIKFLEKNTGVHFHDLRLGKAFLGITSKAQATRE